MKHYFPTFLILNAIVFEVVYGFYRHLFGLVCLKSKNVNIFAFSIARGIRVAFDHSSFTIHRFRLLNLFPDFISWLKIKWKLQLVSEIALGRKDEDFMYYSVVKSGTVEKYIPGYVKTPIKCQYWKIKSIEEILGIPYHDHEEDRIAHLGPTPLKFSSRFLVPKNMTLKECKKWILYVPG